MFRAWLAIWKKSGHWHERGLKKGQYVMGRYGDKGPYDIGNVKIISNLENTLESNLGRKHTSEACANMGNSHRGRKVSEETRQKIRETNIRTYADPAVRERVAAVRVNKGWGHTEESRLKMSASQNKRHMREQIEMLAYELV